MSELTGGQFKVLDLCTAGNTNEQRCREVMEILKSAEKFGKVLIGLR